MLFPLLETIRDVFPALPPDLLDHPARCRIEGVTARLPAALTEQMHLECRLGSSKRVDLLVRVDRAEARDVVADGGRGGLFSSRSWSGIAALCGRWQHDARLAEAVKALWFEFDLLLDQPPAKTPTPRLFVELRQPRRAPASAVVALFDAIFPLVGLPPPGRMLTAALRALPRTSRLLALGCDPTSAAVLPRLCCWHPGRADLRQFLARVRDAAEGERAENVLAALACPDLPLVSHIDGRQALAPGFGVELTFQRPPQLRGAIEEGPFLQRLVAAGLCAPGKAAALRGWPQVAQARLRHQLWPILVVRRINHVKLRVDRGLVVEAKAYLSVHHRFHRGLLR
jgi:hypothetical protein